MKKPLILMILDGFGVGKKGEEAANAILAAKTPNLDRLFSENPLTQIGASGMDVGQVGHTNIGAGRIVYQELTRITKTINDDKLKDNEPIVGAIDSAIENGKALHLLGLLSPGGVHSHSTHLYGLLELCKRNKCIAAVFCKRGMHIQKQGTVSLNNQRVFVIHRKELL